jgi:hypothetical protein
MALPKNADVMVWDNGGKTADRYTVAIRGTSGWDFYTMSEDPSSAQGVNQFSHNATAFQDPEGKRVPLHKLPKPVLSAINQRKQEMSEQINEQEESGMWIQIDGEKIEVIRVDSDGYLPMLYLDDRSEWYVAESSKDAGDAAMKYWKDMANNDIEKIKEIIGDETLIQWGLGQYAGPGWKKVRSLDEWIKLWKDTPEEQWATYDGNEVDVVLSDELKEELGFDDKNAVAYRDN